MTEPIAYPTPQHRRLAALIGEWEGSTRSRFRPDDAWEECPSRATMRWVADGHFILHEYDGTFAGEKTDGTVLYGFDDKRGRFTAAWVDSFHTGTSLLVSEGAETPESLIDVMTHYGGTDGGEPWGWRTVVSTPEPDTLLIQAYNLPPGIEPYVAVETRLRRAR